MSKKIKIVAKKTAKKTAEKIKKKYSLTVVLLSYNGSFWLKKTLETLQKFYLKKTKHQVEVRLVDNASTDDSVAMVQKNFKWVKIIRNDKNLGFAAGNNIALRQLKTDYALLLNTDTELTAQSNFDLLLEYLRAHTDVGLIGPRVLLTGGDLDEASHRGEPTLWAAITYFLGLEKLWPNSKIFGQYHQFYKGLDSIHEVDAITGAAMMAPVSVLKKINYFDEDYFLYGEDLDLAKKVRNSGKKVVFNPEVSIIHHKNKSGIENSSTVVSRKSSRYFYDTMLTYYDKHYAKKYPRSVRFLLRAILFVKKEGA